MNLYKVISFESLGTFMWDTMQGAETPFHNKISHWKVCYLCITFARSFRVWLLVPLAARRPLTFVVCQPELVAFDWHIRIGKLRFECDWKCQWTERPQDDYKMRVTKRKRLNYERQTRGVKSVQWRLGIDSGGMYIFYDFISICH